MTLAILTPAKAKLKDLGVLSQKNRQDDEKCGVQLMLSTTLSNHLLNTIDPQLKPFLFTAADGAAKPVATKKRDNTTGDLDGVEPVTDLTKLTAAGANFKSLKWAAEVTAGRMRIIFATSELLLDDCVLHTITIKPKEGGTVQLDFVVDAPNAGGEIFSKLANYKSREVEITFEQHEPAQEDLVTPAAAAAKAADTPPAQKDATEQFIERNSKAKKPAATEAAAH